MSNPALAPRARFVSWDLLAKADRGGLVGDAQG